MEKQTEPKIENRERNILLTIEYDGTGFSGWQIQPNAPTIQGEVQRVLGIICGCPVTVDGASRTDAGVHALGQRATFSGVFGIPTENMMRAANNLMDDSIRIKEVQEVPKGFHARFDAKGKKYIYHIVNESLNPFGRYRSYYVERHLNIEAMKEGAKYVAGTHDFKAFQAAGGYERETTVRTVRTIGIDARGTDITMEIVGDGFLYNMVRIIAGTLVDIGLGRMLPGDMGSIIAGKERRHAGHTAPPQGLYLAEVYY